MFRGSGTPMPDTPETTPADSLKRFPVVLNDRWRIQDDPLQWLLQRRTGKADKKHSGWSNRSFCRTREGLLRCVREYCGIVDAEALKRLEALPDFHD